MGVVHLAVDPTGREIALKSIAVDDAALAARLLREATVRVRHPNVVRVLGAGLDASGRPYVAMERLTGRSLAEHFEAGPSRAEVLQLVAQAASGVGALHEHGIVHRDLKPANLFVTNEGVVKVLDFGAAVFHEAATLLTLSGGIVGTPSYLSPEQARGDRDLDARADVWALGVILYEGLRGVRPFDRGTALATVLAVLEAQPAPLVAEPELAELVLGCLAKSREARPASAGVLAGRLRSLRSFAGEGPAPPPLDARATLRRVAMVLVDDASDRAAVRGLAEAAGAAFVPLLSRAAAVTFGRDTARGDELLNAVRFAREVLPHARRAVVATARVRDAVDPRAWSEAQSLLASDVDGVLVTSEVAELLEGAIETETTQSVVRVRDVIRARPSEVIEGREAEHARVLHLLDRVIAGDGPRSCAVIGPPGIGKTAFVHWFVGRARSDHDRLSAVEVAATTAHGAPFLTLSDALGIDPPSGATLDVQSALDRRRARVIDALSGLLESCPAVVLVLDDVTWLDAPTRALALELCDLFDGRPLLLLTTSRHTPPGLTTDATIELGPLRSADVAHLAERLLGRRVEPELAADLSARTGGNPLFIEQLLRRARPASTPHDLERVLPATIESAVQAQIDSLEPDLRAAVVRLSVLGHEIAPEHAPSVLGPRADGLVSRLVEADVLQRIRRGERTVLAFRSRIVAEVAYALFEPEETRRLHREIAARLAAQPAPPSDLVAQHAARGGDLPLASHHAREALRQAARVGDGATVLAHLEVALQGASPHERFELTFLAAESAAFVEGARRHGELLRSALVLASTPTERATIEIEIAERDRRDGATADARARLERLLEEPLDTATRPRAVSRFAWVLASQGDAARAEALTASLEVDVDAAPATRALVLDTRGYVLGCVGALGARRRAYERAEALYTQGGDLRRAAAALTNLGDAMLRMGAIEDAETVLRRAVHEARRVGSPLVEAYARTNLGAALGELERAREAVAVLDAAVRLAGRLDDLRLESIARIYRTRITHDAAPGALRSLVDASHEDPTVHALALVSFFDAGFGDDATTRDALALASRPEAIEEGALDLFRALATRVSRREVAPLARAYLDRRYESIDDPEWARVFHAYVARRHPSLAEDWVPQARAD
jgi:tetratricopeptide (TPR) repeat protein